MLRRGGAATENSRFQSQEPLPLKKGRHCSARGGAVSRLTPISKSPEGLEVELSGCIINEIPGFGVSTCVFIYIPVLGAVSDCRSFVFKHIPGSFVNFQYTRRGQNPQPYGSPEIEIRRLPHPSHPSVLRLDDDMHRLHRIDVWCQGKKSRRFAGTRAA